MDDEVPTDSDLNPVWTDFDTIKDTRFSSHRSAVFHYCIIGESYNGGNSSGISRGIGGSDFIVTLGANGGSSGTQAGTLLHELGHNLGLRHGGADNIHYKPNYLSVMNYNYQFRGLRKGGSDSHYDYSRFELEAIDESSVNEFEGLNPVSGITENELALYSVKICSDGSCSWNANAAASVDFNRDENTESDPEAGPIWNQDHAEEVCPELCQELGDTWTGHWWTTQWGEMSVCQRSGDVEADTNKDGFIGVLNTHNDWDNLVFDGGGVIGIAASSGDSVGAELPGRRSLASRSRRSARTSRARISLPGDDEPCPAASE